MKNKSLSSIFTLLGVLAISNTAFAYLPPGYENIKPNEKSLLKTTAGCRQASAGIDLDINNVRARVMSGGDMWYNPGTNQPAYEVPKGSQRHSLYAGSCWIGGIDANGQLKVTAQTYRTVGNDYWAGPIDKVTKDITASSCSEWDRFWKVNASVLQDFRAAYASGGVSAIVDDKYNVIKEWPATGNIYAVGANNNTLPELLGPVDAYGYAPFVDVNEDGIYNWKDGDYPKGYGVDGSNPSQFIWWVFNDVGNTKTMTKTSSIGMEVQTSAFAYSSTDFLNDATFYNYRLINRGNLTLDSCFIATWTDADIGSPFDDYIGCDTARGLGILYNQTNPDRANGQNNYGTRLPMIGVDFFIGPRKYYNDPITNAPTSRLLKMTSFVYYNATTTGDVQEPRNGTQFYNYMTGRTATGVPFSNDQGINSPSVAFGAGPVTPFVFFGDPAVKSEWSMCSEGLPEADRRFVHSSGPFTLLPGEKNDITIGVVWVDDAGACGTASFKKIRAADDIAQALFDNGFKRTVGPEAPLLTIREMDRKLIFYITNPANSNNYNEQYGDPKYTSNPKYRVVSTKAKALGYSDSLYRFEGYQVFQLRGPNVSIFDENGDLTDDAILVYQTDRKNGISQISNFRKNIEYKGSIDQYDISVKVEGKDSGIVHSFVLTDDQFASGDKTLVNYKTYYYQVVAYAHNDFLTFDPHNEVGTQDKAYLIGDNGPGETPIARYPAMPNVMNQNGDTVSNSQYGDGVIVTRIEGAGNSGLDVQVNKQTEDDILKSPTNKIERPTYEAGKSPVQIKVVDPVKVKEGDWRISLIGAMNPADLNRGMLDTATWRIDEIDGNGNTKTIYSERDISTLNEQILADYGLSVSVRQVDAPGYDQTIDNGYIGSDVTFADRTLPWLSGVRDQTGTVLNNWIRSGNAKDATTPVIPCGPFDDVKGDTVIAAYSSMMANNTLTQATWAPYDLCATTDGPSCGFATIPRNTTGTGRMYLSSVAGVSVLKFSEYPNVDLVLTSDKSKWTRCVVLETQTTPALAEGGTKKFFPRAHRSWNMDIDGSGNPLYSTDPKDTGFSYFPGYAINQITGERLNIAFGEDSYLKRFNGADMLWNPTVEQFNNFGEVIFGGKHFTYILNTKYDSCKFFAAEISAPDPLGNGFRSTPAYRAIRWVGIPTLAFGQQLRSLNDGLIPTETRLRFRVNTPFRNVPLTAGQVPVDVKDTANWGNPKYNFSTKGMAPTDYAKVTDADVLMDKIFAVPNPYKGQSSGGNSYESNRLETKIKIINLPQKATVNIYSLDGTLIRRLQKDNNDPSLSWDLLNQAGLPIASGMYLIHVNAYGKDKVLKWFGAMRPLDVTNN